MESIAPLWLAESWDRVGLLVGSPERELRGPVVLTIDLTERVLAEAKAAHASAVIAYHPPIWEPLKQITDATPQQRIILHAIQLGLAVYSPHTALDAVRGGITDWLCEGLSGGGPGKIAGDCRALQPIERVEQTQQVKIITFVPSAEAERVRNALATAGAGIIGNYNVCSFSTPGTGTFLGVEGANPAVGSVGTLQHVAETRLEMVCSRSALALAIETLRRFHPYEEPAIDVYDLRPKPLRSTGAGRRLVLDQPVTLRELAERLKSSVGRTSVRVADATPPGRPSEVVRTIGVCPGAGSSLAGTARAEGCDVFVTGEMSHHNVMAALHSGMSLILGEHTSTERGYLPRLAQRLTGMLPGVETLVSVADRDPLEVV